MTEVAPNPAHPAKFSQPILDVLERLVRAEVKARALDRPLRVLDPFAGVGRVHKLARPGQVETVGVEIEEEWAACHGGTVCDDSIAWMRRQRGLTNDPPGFDVIATSPCYGNRLADSHDARDGSVRHSYTHDLGRPLSPGTAGDLPWGPRYWSFHADAYRAMLGVLAPGGLLLLNVSDFVRSKAIVPAAMWHRGALWGAGFVEAPGERPRVVETQRLRYGENADARVAGELILRARRPTL